MLPSTVLLLMDTAVAKEGLDSSFRFISYCWLKQRVDIVDDDVCDVCEGDGIGSIVSASTTT